MIGIGFVILVHLIVIYALLTGLGTRVMEVMKKPLTAKIIEEIKPPPPPPPPPPKKIIEPPKIKEIQPYVPPPDIPPMVQPPAPVIAVVAPTPPTEPVVIAPPAPPVVEAKPAVRQGISCPRMEKPTFPREAIRAGVEKGRVTAILSVDEKGNVVDVNITSAQPPRVFDRVVRDTLGDWKCLADGTKYKASVEIGFSLSN
jgi:protein TonB